MIGIRIEIQMEVSYHSRPCSAWYHRRCVVGDKGRIRFICISDYE